MEISKLFTAMNASASGLAAQRARINSIAENLANIETTHGADGEPYRRKQTVLAEDTKFQQDLDGVVSRTSDLSAGSAGHLPGFETNPVSHRYTGVKAQIENDPAPFREHFDPSHPDADENGIVRFPNVDMIREMTDLISATRAFEANATAFNASKQMMKKALEL